MENPDDAGVFLHTFRTVPRLSGDERVELEQAGQGETEKEQMENNGGPAKLASIEFRIQQLHNRRFLLLKIKRCTKKDEQHSGGSSEQLVTEYDGDKDDELMAIQKELEELQVKKEELEKAGVSFTASSNGGRFPHPSAVSTLLGFYCNPLKILFEFLVPDQQQQGPSYKETPRGGIYMLPPPQSSKQVTAAAQEPADSILPVEKLGGTSGITTCPSCKEVVVTETHTTRSDTMWILCFLCCFIGCVAGCCLVPFYMKRLRNAHHQCPRCQAKIYTHRPL
ncbi:hypothetical protein CRENBAI_021779 [Crenichthys baileyi]|uniref:LITAF domain-containing protein n=1 Tax=Crenichthys baileyi TaxID=28760 RepID=A0AAV9SNW1_9TELE